MESERGAAHLRPRQWAQTNLELYAQLQSAGWAPPELERLRRAYELAARLHSARFRPTGASFLAHLVRTASILAELEESVEVVLAALLHAAYDQGDFGDDVRGPTASHRARVRETAGVEAEALVAGYSELGWSPAVLERVTKAFDELDALDRTVLKIRVANELEDHLDAGVLYRGDADARLERMQRALPSLVELAHRLGCDPLAEAWLETASQCLGTRIAPELRTGFSGSYDWVPASQKPRAALVWRQRARRVLALLGRARRRPAARIGRGPARA